VNRQCYHVNFSGDKLYAGKIAAEKMDGLNQRLVKKVNGLGDGSYSMMAYSNMVGTHWTVMQN
jgi:hypothetical protein